MGFIYCEVKLKHIYGSKDEKGDDGLWLKSYYTFDETGSKVCMRTRAGFLWQDIQKRCSPKNWGTKYPSYTGCQNLFTCFNEFADWCQSQYGYLSKTNNRFWSIDKDILVPGTNCYSPETCMFVPNWLNSVVTDRAGLRGEYPIGAHWSNSKNGYIGQLNNGEGYVTLGRFKTQEEAHRAWQVAKSEYLRELCSENEVLQGHSVARKALQSVADRIYSEWLFNVETKSVIGA